MHATSSSKRENVVEKDKDRNKDEDTIYFGWR
jgi:hypothetical protein